MHIQIPTLFSTFNDLKTKLIHNYEKYYKSLKTFSTSIFFTFSEILTTPKDGEILVDYSKNRINDEVFQLLVNLVRKHLNRLFRQCRIYNMLQGCHVS